MKRAFSLIELMVVIAIVALLAAVAVPSYKNYVIKSRISQSQQAILRVVDMAEEYAEVRGYFPTRAQLNLPSDPNANTFVPNASIWGGTNGVNFGDSCGRTGNYSAYITPSAVGFDSSITSFGFGCNLYYINGVVKKYCGYFLANSSGWVYGDIMVPGFVNQYEGGVSTAWDNATAALLASSTCR